MIGHKYGKYMGTCCIKFDHTWPTINFVLVKSSVLIAIALGLAGDLVLLDNDGDEGKYKLFGSVSQSCLMMEISQ